MPSPPPVAHEDLLRELAETASYKQGLAAGVQLTPDGKHVLFLRSGPRGRVNDLFVFDVETGKTRTLATSDSLLGGKAETLTPEEIARRERQRVLARGIASFSISPDGTSALVPLSGRLYLVSIADGASRALAGIEEALDPKFSPDGRHVSFVRDHDLFIAELASGKVRAVTIGGTEEVSHGEAEFVAQEEMGRHTGYWWSPESDAILWQETDARAVEPHYIADPAHPEKPPASFKYPRPGRPNVTVALAVSGLDGKVRTRISWDRDAFPYLAAVDWRKGSTPLLVVQARDQRDERLLVADPKTGETRELLREQDDAWINLRPEMPRWIPSKKAFLWMSEADGEWRLSLHGPDGARLRMLDAGEGFRIRKVAHVDESRGLVIVTGGADPTQTHLRALPLDGGAPLALTEKPGDHDGFFAKESATWVHQYSSVEQAPAFEVRRADATAAGMLPSAAAEPPFVPRVEITRVTADGRTYDAAVVRPRDGRAGPLPVLVHVYGGPSEGVVRNSRTDADWFRLQWYADQGFVVVASDNRGLANRGRAWERAIRGDLATHPIEDQVAALRALAMDRPEMDITRVGITGWSYGGYMSALAVLRRPDVFHAAVSGAPVSEWLLYDTHYTERYLGIPTDTKTGGPAYERSSLLPLAPALSRPLLLIHGTADDNVYLEHTLQLADALFRAGKPVELVPIAGQAHMAIRVPEVAPLIHRRAAAFLLEHLSRPGQGAPK